MTERIKTESPKPIYEIVKFETREEWTEMRGSLGAFPMVLNPECYTLLEQHTPLNRKFELAAGLLI